MKAPFFIGWSPRSAAPLAGFLLGCVLLLLTGAAALAIAIGSRPDDPGNGQWLGDRELVGVVVPDPYPILVIDPDAAHPRGHAVIMSGGGKQGVRQEGSRFANQRVRVKGAMVRRGDLEMLLVNEMLPEPGEATPPTVVPLGTWRVVGEICDGKCVPGIMRPGDGLAHKACASVCILGGVPPVLVTAGPVEGRNFMLMGDPAGRPLPEAFRDHVGVRRRMEGTVERIADLLVFRTDVTRAVVP